MRYLLLILVLCVVVKLKAQLHRNYTSYTVDNGLAQNTIWDALQDCKGFMWFGTADGINRFDGYKMYHYKSIEGDSTSLAGTTGFNFFEDKNKQIWIGHDAGLDFYNRVTDKFIRIHQANFSESIIGQSDDGIVWTIVPNNTQTIFGYNPNTLKLVYKIPVNCNWHNSHGSSMSSVKINNTFFIGTSSNKIAQFFPQNRTIKYHSSGLKVTNYLQKLTDTSFCVFHLNGSLLVNVNKRNMPQMNFIEQKHPDNSNFFFCCGLIEGDNLYMGGDLGLFVFDKATLKYKKREIIEVKKDNKVSFVQNMVKDKSNNLYICSNGWGLFVYSPYANKFKHYTNYNPQKSLFKAIFKLNNDKILGGVYGEGFTEFSPDGAFKFFKPLKTEQVETVSAFYPKNKNELWLIYGNRIATLNLLNYQVKLKPNIDTLFGFPFPFFDTINGKLFVNASAQNASILVDVNTQKTVYEFNFNNLSCYKQLSDSILVMGATSGLYLFNLKTKKITATAIKSFVKQLLVYNPNEIYIATINGLYLINNKGKIIKQFTINNGLISSFIYGLLADKYGNIWFSHNKGISVFNPKTSVFKHFGIKDGLQSNEFNTGAFYKDEKGLLYFGGVNGINVIDPEYITENKNPPQVAINEIFLGDLPYKTDTAYNEISQLNLSYLQNTLSFNFSALEFSQPENNTYKYMLAGYDKNWIESGNLHFARYANLPPGNYVFKVLAANENGTWSIVAKTLIISIIPPFWKRTWFYLLMVFVFFVLIALSFYYYNLRQQAKLKLELELQQKLEEERLRISRDLHDNVGAHLSYLITNVEWMLQHPDRLTEYDEQQRLQAMGEAGRNAILTLRQTIWAISHKELTIDDFADRFKQFVLKMLEFDKNVQVHFSESILFDKTLSPAVALNLFRICQEAFNNCLKHANCNNINIQLECTNEVFFSCKIIDDGIGFDWEKAKQKGHYGLVNMEARAKETQAELFVNSQIGMGTTLTILLK